MPKPTAWVCVLAGALGCSLDPGRGLDAFGGDAELPTTSSDATTNASFSEDGTASSSGDAGTAADGEVDGTSSSTGAASAGAGTGVAGSSDEGTDSGGLPPSPGAAMPAGDCEDLSTHVEGPAVTELHVFGVYGSDQGAPIVVEIDRVGVPLVVALVAYDPVVWTLELADGVALEQVVLAGYNDQVVSGYGDAFVTDGSGLSYCAMQWPGDAECETQTFIDWAAMVSGAEFVSFAGCYAPSSFSLE